MENGSWTWSGWLAACWLTLRNGSSAKPRNPKTIFFWLIISVSGIGLSKFHQGDFSYEIFKE